MTEKKKSKQQLWQERQLKEGLCITCGEPSTSKYYCQVHTEAVRKRHRDAYRKKKGLDINAPLNRTGRPKTEEVEK